MKTFNKSEILDRLKLALGFSTDKELSDYLNINKSTLSNWNTRNSIDYDLIFSKCEHISADWLLTGKGDMLKSTADQVEKIQPEAQSDTEKGLMELIHNNATLVETNKKLTDSLLNLTNRLLKDE